MCVRVQAVSTSSVVCVKFPPQAVDEVFLRRLAERFRPVIQVMMFPSLVSPLLQEVVLQEGCSPGGHRSEGFCCLLQAFMELGSAQQAQDLVRYYQNEPHTVQGQQMEFTVSNTFSFPQVEAVLPVGLLRVWSGWPEFFWCLLRAPGW